MNFFSALRALPRRDQLIGGGIVLVLVVVLFVLLTRRPFQVEILPSVPGVTNLQVDSREITPSVIEQIVQDPAQQAEMKRLLEENKKLKLQVTQLSATVAKLTSTGGGKVVTVPRDSVPEPLRLDPPIDLSDDTPSLPESGLYEFKDWRLHFVTDGSTAKYELNQKFEVLSTTGRNKDGQPMSLVHVYELGPNEERTQLKTDTLNIFADETKPHWMFGHPNLQGGGAVVVDSPKKLSKGFVVSTQWIRKGRTKAAEDSSIALLSPVVFVSDTTKELGVFPVSVNVGQIPHTPFNDMWVSPYVGVFSGAKPTRSTLNFGIGLTTTF